MTYNDIVKWISFIFFGLAGFIHIGFFIFESFILPKKDGYSPQVKIWAFNQGFYNLFLAIAMFMGLYYVRQFDIKTAGAFVSFSGLSMIAAGLVLMYSYRKMWKMALVQMVPPMIGFVFLALHVIDRLSLKS